MREYVIAYVDDMLRKYPDCGVIVICDINQPRDSFYIRIKGIHKW